MLLYHRPSRAIPAIDMACDFSILDLHFALAGNCDAGIPGEGGCPGEGPGGGDSIVYLLNVMEVEGCIPKPGCH